MGAAPLVVPGWQADETREPRNWYANSTTRSSLKAKLHDDNYTEALTESGKVNNAMREAIMTIVGTRGMESNMELDTDVEENLSAVPKRRAAVEMLIAVITRLRNQNILNFFVVVLSVIALGCNVSVQFWALLTSFGVLFSRTWTITLVREMGDEISNRKLDCASLKVGLCVADNKAYFDKVSLMHAPGIEGVTEGPPKANGRFLYTVNNFQVPLLMLDGDVDIPPGIAKSY
jgi:hypothetical protein